MNSNEITYLNRLEYNLKGSAAEQNKKQFCDWRMLLLDIYNHLFRQDPEYIGEWDLTEETSGGIWGFGEVKTYWLKQGDGNYIQIPERLHRQKSSRRDKLSLEYLRKAYELIAPNVEEINKTNMAMEDYEDINDPASYARLLQYREHEKLSAIGIIGKNSMVNIVNGLTDLDVKQLVANAHKSIKDYEDEIVKLVEEAKVRKAKADKQAEYKARMNAEWEAEQLAKREVELARKQKVQQENKYHMAEMLATSTRKSMT